MNQPQGKKKGVKFEQTDKGTIVTYDDGTKEEIEGIFVMDKVMEDMKKKEDKED